MGTIFFNSLLLIDPPVFIDHHRIAVHGQDRFRRALPQGAKKWAVVGPPDPKTVLENYVSAQTDVTKASLQLNCSGS